MSHPKTLLLIQTGGTIDKDYPRTNLGYSFEISEPAISKVLERGKIGFEVETVTVCRKDSQDITGEDRASLAKTCQASPHPHILITHGTDTLIQTAAYLAQHQCPPGKTVVLTGAFKPETFKDSDSDFNIGVAVGALQAGLEAGVYVAMNGLVHQWDRVTRDSATDMFVAKA